MIKRWIALAALWALCLAAPATVLAGNRKVPDGIQSRTGEESIYQAQEAGINSQGLKIITNPLWEYNEADHTYKLVKSRDREGLRTYFVQEDGALQLGRPSGHYYAFDENGNMLTGVRTVKGVRYSFTPREKAVKDTSEVTPDQTTFGMAMTDSWARSGESWYYFGSSGQDGKKTGPQKINGSYYYLNKRGVPYKNCFKTISKKKYYYSSSGKRASYTGWKTIQNKKYYFSKNHFVTVKKGWQRISGKYYYFSPKGVMYAKKWATINKKRYYFKEDGQRASKWTKVGSAYYYFTKSGTLDRNTVAKEGDDYYFVTSKGKRGANILKNVGIKKTMGKKEKLRACFDYVVRNCRYVGGEVWPPKGWEPYHAYKMLTAKRGNCYDYAAAFCYLAKAVGYEDAVCISGRRAYGDGSLHPHSWCEIKGKVYDPKITWSNGNYLFGTSYGNLPFAYRK